MKIRLRDYIYFLLYIFPPKTDRIKRRYYLRKVDERNHNNFKEDVWRVKCFCLTPTSYIQYSSLFTPFLHLFRSQNLHKYQPSRSLLLILFHTLTSWKGRTHPVFEERSKSITPVTRVGNSVIRTINVGAIRDSEIIINISTGRTTEYGH